MQLFMDYGGIKSKDLIGEIRMANEERITADGAIDRYADMVYRLALSQMRNTVDADDLFQEVFVRLVNHIQDLESWEHVKAWLIRVTINCAKKYYGQYWNKNVDYMDAPERMAGDNGAYELSEEHPVWEAVHKLPPKYRVVIHLYYFEERTIAEIAQLTEQKESTVKSQLRRGREMLKKLLSNNGIDSV